MNKMITAFIWIGLGIHFLILCNKTKIGRDSIGWIIFLYLAGLGFMGGAGYHFYKSLEKLIGG